ncbi:melanocortin receptor 5-like [Amphiura filiformis]|uniref:melanocortin receptor 5-like n=1 Tax=Amphiura filiformis TaxID=82378 RepID=UPI003B211EA5
MSLRYFWGEFFDRWSLILVSSTCSLAFIFNGTVMMLICGHRNLRRPQNIFVVNLALADIGTCIVAVCDTFQRHLTILEMEPILNAMLLVSILSIFAIAVDRYVALKGAPLKHHTMITAPRVVFACTLIWIFSFIICSIEYIIPRSHKVISFFFSPISVISTLILTAITYSLIFYSLRKPIIGSSLSRHYVDIRRRRTKRVLKTFTIILVTNFICWIPMCVFLLIEYVSEQESLSDTFWIAATFSFDLAALNAAVNPICFLWRLPEAKRLLNNPSHELRQLMCSAGCQSHNGNRGVFHYSSNKEDDNNISCTGGGKNQNDIPMTNV